MAASAPTIPIRLSQVDISREILDRRAGMYKALTCDVDEFFEQCDPEKGPLCLYGLPDRTWQVCPPTENVPPQIPVPTLGINFERDRMERKEWLQMVARYSDSWLLAVAFCRAGCYRHDKESRKWIFERINDYPVLLEVVTGMATTRRPRRRHRKRKIKDIHEDLDDKKEEKEERVEGVQEGRRGRRGGRGGRRRQF